jgi:hypothetical protein
MGFLSKIGASVTGNPDYRFGDISRAAGGAIAVRLSPSAPPVPQHNSTRTLAPLAAPCRLAHGCR